VPIYARCDSFMLLELAREVALVGIAEIRSDLERPMFLVCKTDAAKAD